eukprot:4388933-Pleurochrysis_carterae.AAC.1
MRPRACSARRRWCERRQCCEERDGQHRELGKAREHPRRGGLAPFAHYTLTTTSTCCALSTTTACS